MASSVIDKSHEAPIQPGAYVFINVKRTQTEHATIQPDNQLTKCKYPTRYHKGGGFDNMFVSNGKYGRGHNYSQTTLNSKKSIRTEEAKKQRQLGLVCLLLFCALLLAVGVALLVYFLLLP
ncbi:hypothetical protein ScPMuIL_017969, partial [Solemya velum]